MINQDAQYEEVGAWPGQRLMSRVMPNGTRRSYLRFAALGDLFACPPEDSETTGWAEILANTLSTDHDVSYRHLACPRATSAQVRREQTPDAQSHRANMAVLVAGLSDVYSEEWETDVVRHRLMRVADELSWSGATLLTVRFIALTSSDDVRTRRIASRIDALNDIYDEIDDAYGGLRLDLATIPEASDRAFWAIPGLQPSETGHHLIAGAFTRLLAAHGLKAAA